MSESQYDDIVAECVARQITVEQQQREANAKLIEALTVDDKRRILFQQTLACQCDDYSDFIRDVLWEGFPGPGYKSMTPEQVEEEWRDTIEGLDQDEIMCMIYNFKE